MVRFCCGPKYPSCFQKQSVRCRWNWKLLKAGKSSENIKKFCFQTVFPIWWSKISTPLPKFLNSFCNLLSNYFCNSSKNQLDANETGKCWKQTKIMRISKKIIFKPFFDMMEHKIDPQKWVKVAEQWKKINCFWWRLSAVSCLMMPALTKKISWSADSGKKVQHGELIEDTVNFRMKCGEMRWKVYFHRVFYTSFCGECGESRWIVFFLRVLGAG